MKKIAILGIGAAVFTVVRAEAQKIASVNIQEIVTSMPEYAEADTATEKYQQQLYQQYQALQQELQSQAGTFIKDSAKMTAAVKQVKRISLQDLNTRVVQFQQNMNQQVNNKYDELLKPVIDKADAAVSVVAKARGYSYVVNDLKEGGIPLLITKSKTDDLTAAVKAKLGLKH